jgi:hypothetical protein
MTAINNLNDFNEKGDYLWPQNLTKYQPTGSEKHAMSSERFWMKPIFQIHKDLVSGVRFSSIQSG